MATMKDMWDYPNNSANGYMSDSANWSDDESFGMDQRIDELLNGNYKIWRNLDPVADLSQTVDTANEVIAKFKNYIDSFASSENMSFYKIHNQPIIVATKKLIDSETITAANVDTTSATVTVSGAHEFENGMKMTVSGMNNSWSRFNDQDFYSSDVSNAANGTLKLRNGGPSGTYVNFPTSSFTADGYNVDTSRSDAAMTLNLSSYSYGIINSAGENITSISGSFNDIVGEPGTIYAKDEGSGVYSLWQDSSFTNEVGYNNITPSTANQVTITVQTGTNPGVITTDRELGPKELLLRMNNSITDGGSNTFLNINTDIFVQATGNTNEYRVYSDQSRSTGVDFDLETVYNLTEAEVDTSADTLIVDLGTTGIPDGTNVEFAAIQKNGTNLIGTTLYTEYVSGNDYKLYTDSGRTTAVVPTTDFTTLNHTLTGDIDFSGATPLITTTTTLGANDLIVKPGSVNFASGTDVLYLTATGGTNEYEVYTNSGRTTAASAQTVTITECVNFEELNQTSATNSKIYVAPKYTDNDVNLTDSKIAKSDFMTSIDGPHGPNYGNTDFGLFKISTSVTDDFDGDLPDEITGLEPPASGDALAGVPVSNLTLGANENWIFKKTARVLDGDPLYTLSKSDVSSTPYYKENQMYINTGLPPILGKADDVDDGYTEYTLTRNGTTYLGINVLNNWRTVLHSYSNSVTIPSSVKAYTPYYFTDANGITLVGVFHQAATTSDYKIVFWSIDEWNINGHPLDEVVAPDANTVTVHTLFQPVTHQNTAPATGTINLANYMLVSADGSSNLTTNETGGSNNVGGTYNFTGCRFYMDASTVASATELRFDSIQIPKYLKYCAGEQDKIYSDYDSGTGTAINVENTYASFPTSDTTLNPYWNYFRNGDIVTIGGTDYVMYSRAMWTSRLTFQDDGIAYNFRAFDYNGTLGFSDPSVGINNSDKLAEEWVFIEVDQTSLPVDTLTWTPKVFTMSKGSISGSELEWTLDAINVTVGTDTVVEGSTLKNAWLTGQSFTWTVKSTQDSVIKPYNMGTATIDQPAIPTSTAPASPYNFGTITVTPGGFTAATTGSIAPATDEPYKYEIDTVSIKLPGNEVYSYQDSSNVTQYEAQVDTTGYWAIDGTSKTLYSSTGETAAQFTVGVDGSGYLNSITLTEEADAEGRYADSGDIVIPLTTRADEYVAPSTYSEDVWDTDDEWDDDGFASGAKQWPRHIAPISARITATQPSSVTRSQNGTKYVRSSGVIKHQLEVTYPPMTYDDFREFEATVEAARGQATPFYFNVINLDDPGRNILIHRTDSERTGGLASPYNMRIREPVSVGDKTILYEGFPSNQSNVFLKGEYLIADMGFANGNLFQVINDNVDSNVFGEAKIRIPYGSRNSQLVSQSHYKIPSHIVVTLADDEFEYTVGTDELYRFSCRFDFDEYK